MVESSQPSFRAASPTLHSEQGPVGFKTHGLSKSNWTSGGLAQLASLQHVDASRTFVQGDPAQEILVLCVIKPFPPLSMQNVATSTAVPTVLHFAPMKRCLSRGFHTVPLAPSTHPPGHWSQEVRSFGVRSASFQ